MFKNKKLIVVNLLTIIAFIIVVSIGVQKADTSKKSSDGKESEKMDKKTQGLITKNNPGKSAYLYKLKDNDEFAFIIDEEEELIEEVIEEDVVEQVLAEDENVEEDQGPSINNAPVQQEVSQGQGTNNTGSQPSKPPKQYSEPKPDPKPTPKPDPKPEEESKPEPKPEEPEEPKKPSKPELPDGEISNEGTE